MQEGRDFHGLLFYLNSPPKRLRAEHFKKSPHGISQFAPTIRPERTQQLTPKATGLSDQLQRTGDSPPATIIKPKGCEVFTPDKTQQRSARGLFSVASYGDSPSHPFYLLPSFIMTLRQDVFSVHLLQTAIYY